MGGSQGTLGGSQGTRTYRICQVSNKLRPPCHGAGHDGCGGGCTRPLEEEVSVIARCYIEEEESVCSNELRVLISSKGKAVAYSKPDRAPNQRIHQILNARQPQYRTHPPAKRQMRLDKMQGKSG